MVPGYLAYMTKCRQYVDNNNNKNNKYVTIKSDNTCQQRFWMPSCMEWNTTVPLR